jgi:hypothetical protein
MTAHINIVSGTGPIINATVVINETPTGAINGTNSLFALANTPDPKNIEVIINGLLEINFTVSGSIITLATAPLTGYVVRVNYLLNGVANPGISINESPTGAINGVNTTFTLENTPNVPNIEVAVNGLIDPNLTVFGNTFTLATAPLTGYTVRATYLIKGETNPDVSINETPTGAINGTNTLFTLSFIPTNPNIEVVVNGLVDPDFSMFGRTITLATAPLTGYTLRATYLA